MTYKDKDGFDGKVMRIDEDQNIFYIKVKWLFRTRKISILKGTIVSITLAI